MIQVNHVAVQLLMNDKVYLPSVNITEKLEILFIYLFLEYCSLLIMADKKSFTKSFFYVMKLKVVSFSAEAFCDSR